MFAYCGNSPITNKDSQGFFYVCFYDEIVDPDDPDNKDRSGFAYVPNPIDSGYQYWVDLTFASNTSSHGGGLYGSGYTSGGTYSPPGKTNTQSSTCKVIGGGHGSDAHKQAIDDKISELKATENYYVIYGNRALKTAGLNGNFRPDIIAIACNGKIEVWEYASPSQAPGTYGYRALQEKINVMSELNPNVHFHDIQ